MTAKITFHPLGNADCTRLDLADGQKMLVDYADVRNADDSSDRRIDLPKELKNDLRAARRDYFNVVLFTHLDDDHCHGVGDFFWLDHAKKYQSEDRIKIRELWVPAAAILEEGAKDSARLVRQEARYRLKRGSGVRVFSRPEKLKDWLEENGLTLKDRERPHYRRWPMCSWVLDGWQGTGGVLHPLPVRMAPGREGDRRP